MNTKAITRSAMFCALYGVLIVLNNMTAMSIGSYFPWLFALPMMVDALMFDPKVSSACFGAMVILTLILGSMTTWLPALSFLCAGFAYGLCIRKQWPFWLRFVVVFGLLFVDEMLSVTVFASVFGYTPEAASEIMSYITHFISWTGFLILSSALLALLEMLVLECLGPILMARLKIHIPRRKTAFFSFQIPVPFAWAALGFGCACFLIWTDMLSCPVGLKDFFVIGFFLLFVAFDIQGALYLLVRMARKPAFWKTLLLMAACVIPPVCFLVALYGWAGTVKRSYHNPSAVR